MKKLLIAITVLCISTSMASSQGSKEVLKKMHNRFAGKWYKTFTFNQTTEFYRNDSLLRSETWYEHIQYPKNFRIDFGHPDSGRAVIYKNDSSFLFRNGLLARARADENDLLFLLGGMYFYSYEEALTKLSSYGYNLDKFHEDKWNGKDVYVIGAGKGEDSVNQLWFEKENYNLVRMIRYEDKNKQEAWFEDHVKLGGGIAETVVRFYINDQLIQVEKYHDLEVNADIPKEVFDTQDFVRRKG